MGVAGLVGAQRQELGVRLFLECALERARILDRHRDVGSHSRTDDRDPIERTHARAAHPAVVGRRGCVPALERIAGVEAVAPGARGRMGEEAVLAVPAGTVGEGVERVDVDQPPVAVQGYAETSRRVAEYRLAAVGQLSEQAMVVLVVDPVAVHRQLRRWPAPVRHLEPRRGQRRRPGDKPQVGPGDVPGLQRPERAVGGPAGGDLEGERRTVVGLTVVNEVLPVAAVAVLAPATRVVDLELDLGGACRRRASVDGAPDEHVEALAAGRVADQRLALVVDRERDVSGVAAEQLRRARRSRCSRTSEHRRAKQRHGERDVPNCPQLHGVVIGREAAGNHRSDECSSPVPGRRHARPAGSLRWQREASHAGATRAGHRRAESRPGRRLRVPCPTHDKRCYVELSKSGPRAAPGPGPPSGQGSRRPPRRGGSELLAKSGLSGRARALNRDGVRVDCRAAPSTERR